ncbi:MAG: J domain-containing protein [Bdellovibrionota bacterium]
MAKTTISDESEKPLFVDEKAAAAPLASGPAFDLMSQLLGTTEAKFFEGKSHFSILKTPYKTAKQKTSPPAPAPELTVLLTQLTPAQKTALQKMISLGATELKDAVLLGESRLKKSFRRLAKSFHPDHQTHFTASQKQRSSQSFRELRESYNILIGAFSKAQQAA